MTFVTSETIYCQVWCLLIPIDINRNEAKKKSSGADYGRLGVVFTVFLFCVQMEVTFQLPGSRRDFRYSL